MTGRAGWIIARTQKARLILQQTHDLFLIPQMIAACDRIDARAEKFARCGRGNTGTTRGVLTVGDDERDTMLLTQLRHKLRHSLASRRSHHISDEEDFHGRNLTSATREGNIIVSMRCSRESFHSEGTSRCPSVL